MSSAALVYENGELRVQEATPADGGALLTMLDAHAAYLGRARGAGMDAARLRRFVFAPGAFLHALVAARTGAERDPLGFAFCYACFSTWRGCPGVYVLDLFVTDAARGAGVGRGLLAGVTRLGARWEAAFITLAVDVANQYAIGFYESLGFLTEGGDRMMVLEGDAYASLART